MNSAGIGKPTNKYYNAIQEGYLQNNLDTLEDLGHIRDLYFEDNRLFIATKNKGIYIYDVISEIGENSIPLNNGQYLEQLYHSGEEWNSDKDLRSIYYADNIFIVIITFLKVVEA